MIDALLVQNHIASTNHYRSFVFSQNRFQRGDFIEDTFGQVQLNDCKRPTSEEGIEVHKKYATWLYYPNDGGTRHLFHLHGRKFLTETGKKKYEERQRKEHLGWKIRQDAKGAVAQEEGYEDDVNLETFFIEGSG